MAKFTTRGPKGDQGTPGNANPQDTYDKLYATNNGNGTNFKVGDDVWIGDVNTSNHMSVQGVQDSSKAGILLGSNKTESISSNGTDLTLTADNDIVLRPDSTYAYISTPEIGGGNRIATWDYVNTTINTGRHGSSASYWSTVDQGPFAKNTIQPMTLDSTDWQTGITLESGSRIKITNAGKYNISFSAQMHQTSSSGIVNVWLAKNGTPVANTNTRFDITANNPYSVAAWNFFVNANALDYYQIMWSSDDNHTVIEALPATGSGATLHPEIPSVIITIDQVG